MIEQQNPIVQLTQRLNAHEKKMQRYSASVCRQYLQPYSKLPLGWDRGSVAFLSAYADHHMFYSVSLSYGVTVTMLGAYLGECIISSYSGRWVKFTTGSIEVSVSSLFLVNPVFMVESHLQFREDKTILEYYDWVGEVMQSRKGDWTK